MRQAGADIKKDIRGKVAWRSPSNIAIIKYWGKTGYQQPLTSSVSMTLSGSYTETTVSYSPSSQQGTISISFSFEGKENPGFAKKISTYLQNITDDFPFLKELHLDIESSNSFPHSAGIASSASAMSALALCILSIAFRINPGSIKKQNFFREASRLARLGSGSACRSVFPAWVVWGKTSAFAQSSQLYAVNIDSMVHPAFEDMQDTILIVDSGPKEVSSSKGHDLMKEHPFLEQRINQANINIWSLKKALQQGDIDAFIDIAENEAFTLHALMKSSTPGYTLTKPNTLEIIKRLHLFRERTGTRVCFTLDAGPNVHLIYPLKEKQKVIDWMHKEVLELCENNSWIDDNIGAGPQLLINEEYK